jgi:hypothetical protein
MSILAIPPHQLRVLVAIAASWRVRGCGPTTSELRELQRWTDPINAVYRLGCSGLIAQDWQYGKRVPRSLRPTARAWAELDAIVPPLLEADAAE